MELITLSFSQKSRKSKREEVEAYIRENILSRENHTVIVAGLESRRGRNKVFQVLVLNDVKRTLQFADGRIYRHPIEEGKEKMYLEYLSKFPCIFVCKYGIGREKNFGSGIIFRSRRKVSR